MSSPRPRSPRPCRSTPSSTRHTLSYQLRELIDARGLTAYALGQQSGVDPGVVQRFLKGERDIRLETADRLAWSLGLRLVEVARKGRTSVRAGALSAVVSEVRSEPPENSDGMEIDRLI